MPRSGSIRTTRPRSMTRAGRGSWPGHPTRGSWRSARPVSTTTACSARSRTSSPTCGATSRSRSTPASRPSSTAARPTAGATRRTRSSPSCAWPGSAGPPGPPRSASRPPAVIHSFSGPLDYARTVIDLGLAVSFSGLVFRRGEEASADAVALVPADRLLVETDSPFLAPPGAPRSRNEPEWVRVTAAWAGGAARDDTRRAGA